MINVYNNINIFTCYKNFYIIENEKATLIRKITCIFLFKFGLWVHNSITYYYFFYFK